MTNLSFPFGIKLFDIELNKKCNARCSYCRIANQKGAFSDEEMPYDVLQRFYQRLTSNPPVGDEYYCVNLDETEPLFSFDLIKRAFDEFDIEPQNRFFHSITTNGKLLTQDIIKFCASHQITIKISVDGTKENCFKEKGIDLDNLIEVCKTSPVPKLICFSYVVSKQRLESLYEDLEQLFKLYQEGFGEWDILFNVMELWTDEEFEKVTSIVKKFMVNHYIPESNYLFTNRWNQRPMMGMKVCVDGTLKVWPANHTCRKPIDKGFNTFNTRLGTIFDPNDNKLQSFIFYYGLDYHDTTIIGSKCDKCENYKLCHRVEKKTHFLFSNEDCQVYRFFNTIRRGIMEKRIDYQKIKDSLSLTGVCLNLTNSCNMKCKYCFTHPSDDEITLSTAQAAVMWIKSNQGHSSNTHINFFGGEPMLKYDEIIKPLIEWSEKMGIDKITYGMTTNGSLFTPEKIDWLADHHVSILLSIDGGPQTQNENRILKDGGDSFERVSGYLPYLLHRNPYLTFRSTLDPENVGEMYTNYLWAVSLGFASYYVMPNEFTDWSKDVLKEMAIQLRRIYWEMYDRISNDAPVPIFNFFFQELFGFFGMKKVKPETPWQRCGLGTTSIGIGVNGNIFGCQEHNTSDTDSPFYLGNIFKNGIEEDRHERLLTMYLADLPEDYNACPSHCYGVNKDLKETTEVWKVWSGTTKSTIKEILMHAAEHDNQKFLTFIETKGKELM